jgi:hypothetical protein
MKSFLIVVGFIVIIIVVRMVVSRVLGLAFNPLEAKLRQKLLGTGPTASGPTASGPTASGSTAASYRTAAGPTAAAGAGTNHAFATGGAPPRTIAPASGNGLPARPGDGLSAGPGDELAAAGQPVSPGLESFQVVNRAVTTLAAHLPDATGTGTGTGAGAGSGAARALFDAVAEALRAEDETALLDGFVRDPQDDSQLKRALRQHLRRHPEATAELSRLTTATA